MFRGGGVYEIETSLRRRCGAAGPLHLTMAKASAVTWEFDFTLSRGNGFFEVDPTFCYPSVGQPTNDLQCCRCGYKHYRRWRSFWSSPLHTRQRFSDKLHARRMQFAPPRCRPRTMMLIGPAGFGVVAYRSEEQGRATDCLTPKSERRGSMSKSRAAER